LGLAGVLVVLFLLFRSFRALLTLTLPLLAGLVWAMGAAQLLLGHLTTMTSLITSLLMGLGIDAGIHMLSRARRERREHDDETAIRRAFDGLLAPLLVASTTTIGAFVVMSTSGYPALQEFGILAGAGVGMCLLSMVTIYPALLKLVGIKKPPAQRVGAGWLTHLLLDRPGLVFTALLMLTVFSVPGVHQMRKDGFERNSRELQSDSARERIEADTELTRKILGMSVQSCLLLAGDYEQMERTYEAALKELAYRKGRGESVVGDLVAAPRFLPPKAVDQGARREVIESLAEDFDEGTWARLEGKVELDEFGDPVGSGSDSQEESKPVLTSEQVKDLRAMLEAQPFGPDDLPPIILAGLRGKTGQWAILGHPQHSAADILHDVAFMEETAHYGASEEGFAYAGEAAVPATMYMEMRDEWSVVLGMASILIFGIVLWQVRSFAQTMMTVLPLIVGLWWLLGFMGSSGVLFTLVNVPILPAVLGIGVDNGVYLAVAIARRGETPEGLRLAVDGTGRAILAATATTCCGFASFLVADSGSLRSIGLLALIGVAMAAFAALAVLPTLGELRARRRRDAAAADGVVTPAPPGAPPITGPHPHL
jgi:predicted exporter